MESFYPFLTFLIPIFSFFNLKIQKDVVFVKIKAKKKKNREPVRPKTWPSHRFLPVLTGSGRVNCMTDPNVGSNRPTHRFTVQPAGPSRVLKLCILIQGIGFIYFFFFKSFSSYELMVLIMLNKHIGPTSVEKYC